MDFLAILERQKKLKRVFLNTKIQHLSKIIKTVGVRNPKLMIAKFAIAPQKMYKNFCSYIRKKFSKLLKPNNPKFEQIYRVLGLKT